MTEGRTDDGYGWRGFRSPVGMKQKDRAPFGPGLSFGSPCPRVTVPTCPLAAAPPLLLEPGVRLVAAAQDVRHEVEDLFLREHAQQHGRHG